MSNDDRGRAKIVGMGKRPVRWVLRSFTARFRSFAIRPSSVVCRRLGLLITPFSFSLSLSIPSHTHTHKQTRTPQAKAHLPFFPDSRTNEGTNELAFRICLSCGGMIPPTPPQPPSLLGNLELSMAKPKTDRQTRAEPRRVARHLEHFFSQAELRVTELLRSESSEKKEKGSLFPSQKLAAGERTTCFFLELGSLLLFGLLLRTDRGSRLLSSVSFMPLLSFFAPFNAIVVESRRGPTAGHFTTKSGYTKLPTTDRRQDRGPSSCSSSIFSR